MRFTGGGVGHSVHYATEPEAGRSDDGDGVEQQMDDEEGSTTEESFHPLGEDEMNEAITDDDIDSDIESADSNKDEELDGMGEGYESA